MTNLKELEQKYLGTFKTEEQARDAYNNSQNK